MAKEVVERLRIISFFYPSWCHQGKQLVHTGKKQTQHALCCVTAKMISICDNSSPKKKRMVTERSIWQRVNFE